VTCDDIRPKLTAYLEGELEGDRGTVVRGHLRTCEACRIEAAREARLRDELRALPALDPPTSLWAGVQERLAKTEIAAASRPAWRRWLSQLAQVGGRRLALGGALAAATITIVVWRVRPEPTGVRVIDVPQTVIAAYHAKPTFNCPTTAPAAAVDVSDDLGLDSARATATYCEAVADLQASAQQARTRWSAEQTTTFDTKVAVLEAAVTGAGDARTRTRALRTLVRYLRGAAVRDQVALASISVDGGVR